jgi:hypothetical protein
LVNPLTVSGIHATRVSPGSTSLGTKTTGIWGLLRGRTGGLKKGRA